MRTETKQVWDRLLRTDEVLEMTGLSRTTLWRVEKEDPSFPVRRKVSRQITGFLESEIMAWISSRPAAREVA